MTPDNAIQYGTARQWLTLDGYCRHVGRTERTVRRWLAKGQLPDAVLLDGQWTIPADAVPGEPAPVADLATLTHDTTPDMTGGILMQPALPFQLVTLEEVAEQLDTTVAVIRRLGRAGKLDIGPYGEHGALRVWIEAHA